MSTCDLKLNVFRCRDGYLVCPEFMYLPDHAFASLAHVSPLLGTLVCGWFPEMVCRNVRAAINDDFFAFLPYEEAVFAGLPSGIMDDDLRRTSHGRKRADDDDRLSPLLGTSERKR